MAGARPHYKTSGVEQHFTPEQIERQKQHRRERKVCPDDDLAIERILRVYNAASTLDLDQGLSWYRRANALCAEIADRYPNLVPSPIHVAGIVATLSPQLSWSQNIQRATELIEMGSTRGRQDREQTAREIMNGDHPAEKLFEKQRQNFKVRSFFMNMAFPDWPKISGNCDLPDYVVNQPAYVTLDRHAWTMLYNDRTITDVLVATPRKFYDWGQAIFVAAAEEIGEILPHDLQAVTWVVWRQKRPILSEHDHPRLFVTP